jgi:hypothetical protein
LRKQELEGFLKAGAYWISETLVEEQVEDNMMCLNNYLRENDSRPLKVENQPDLLGCRQCATYRWKALDEGYNFDIEHIVIGGL